MTLRELERIRLSGQRPQFGLVLLRDSTTRDRGGDDLVVSRRDRDFGPLFGLVVHVALSSWDRWVLALLERVFAAKPELVVLTDPVSRCLIWAYHGGARQPVALDCADWQLAAHPAASALRRRHSEWFRSLYPEAA